MAEIIFVVFMVFSFLFIRFINENHATVPAFLFNSLNPFQHMRSLTFLSVFCLLLISGTASAQSRSDYDFAMNKFVKAYNAMDTINIVKMWPPEKRAGIAKLFSGKQLAEDQERFGKILSYKYVGIDSAGTSKATVFKTAFSVAGTRASSFTLNQKNLFSSFNLIDMSPQITKMLKK